QAEDGIRDDLVTGVQTCALPISRTAGWGLAAAAAGIAAWARLGASAAAPGAVTHYVLDPAKSSLAFNFDQAGAQNKGKFTRFQEIGRASCRERVEVWGMGGWVNE